MKTVNKYSVSIGTTLAGLFAMVISAPVFAGTNGIPIQGNQACVVQLYQSSSNSVLIAKAAEGLSGSYRLTANQVRDVNVVDINLVGRFSSSSGEDAVLSRATLGMGYIARGARGGLDEFRDAEYGQDAALFVQLDVFDTGGNLICRTSNVITVPYEFLFPRQRPSYARAQPQVRQLDSTRVAREAAAERRREAEAALSRRIPGASSERRRRPRSAVLSRRRY